MKILLVEDDANLGMVLKTYLEQNKLKVEWVRNGAEGWNALHKSDYDLCVLDVMMPEMDGFTLAEKISSSGSGTPFVFLTAREQKQDILKGYRVGAKDYISKPFDPEILLYKIKALAESGGFEFKEKEIEFLDYRLDLERRELSKDSEDHFRLSPKECDLLRLLLSKMNEVLSREEVLGTIWKESNYFTARSMDVYINKLRKKFGQDARVTIDNIHGRGFVFRVEE